MTTRFDVPSGMTHGPITVDYALEAGALRLAQAHEPAGTIDVLVLADEHARSLINAIATVSPTIAEQTEYESEQSVPADFHYAVCTGTDSGAIELGAHYHCGRTVALLRQPDGADEDGEVTFSTLALNADRIDGLIESLQTLKRLVL